MTCCHLNYLHTVNPWICHMPHQCLFKNNYLVTSNIKQRHLMTLQLRKASPACLQISADSHSSLAFPFILKIGLFFWSLVVILNRVNRRNVNFRLQREVVKHNPLPETFKYTTAFLNTEDSLANHKVTKLSNIRFQISRMPLSLAAQLDSHPTVSTAIIRKTFLSGVKRHSIYQKHTSPKRLYNTQYPSPLKKSGGKPIMLIS